MQGEAGVGEFVGFAEELACLEAAWFHHVSAGGAVGVDVAQADLAAGAQGQLDQRGVL